jgi:hypothetical protein
MNMKASGAFSATTAWAEMSARGIVEDHRLANPEHEIHALARSRFARARYTVPVAARSEEHGLLCAWKA